MITLSDIITLVDVSGKTIEQLQDLLSLQPCGHPKVCIFSSDEGTHYCRWCEDVARQTAESERRFQEEHALRKKAEGESE